MQRSDPKVYDFYQSQLWKKVRKNYILSKYHICERCGAIGTYVHHKTYINADNIDDENITLNYDNLELLCHKCHNIEHTSDINYIFDSEGNLIRNKNSEIKKEIRKLIK